jgi:hypothetical protein
LVGPCGNAPFPLSARRTGHADLPHPALGQAFTSSPAARCGQAGSDLRARSACKDARVDRPALRRLTLCLNLNVGFRYEHSSDWISSISLQPRRGRGRCPGSTGVLVGFVAGWIEEIENISETSDSNRVKYISDIRVVPDLRRGGSPQNTQRQRSSICPTSESRACAWWTRRRLRRCCVRSEPAGDRASR